MRRGDRVLIIVFVLVVVERVDCLIVVESSLAVFDVGLGVRRRRLLIVAAAERRKGVAVAVDPLSVELT